MYRLGDAESGRRGEERCRRIRLEAHQVHAVAEAVIVHGLLWAVTGRG